MTNNDKKRSLNENKILNPYWDTEENLSKEW